MLALRAWPKAAESAGLLLFVYLSGIAVIGTVRGVSDCGCFGSLSLPPGLLLAFDVVSAGALLWGLSRRFGGIPNWTPPFPIGLVVGLWLGLATGSALYPRLGNTTRSLYREAIEAAESVILDTSELANRKLSLLAFIRIDADLSQGRWKLILARAGCPRCESRLRGGECGSEGGERLAVILAEKKKNWKPPSECNAIVGSLDPAKRWIFEAPLVLRLVEGRVVEAHSANER
jgi:hypothetical protein